MTQGEMLFAAALKATGRSSLTEYLKTQNITDEETKRAATTRYRELPLLLDPALQEYAAGVLAGACGRIINTAERFPATLWLGGVEDTFDGRDFLGNFDHFVKLLQERTNAYAPKRTGWIVEPTTNIDGHRTNASTKAMHALFLDVDGRGDWHHLIDRLVVLQFAFIAYQSGGWTPTTPKWRIVFPLAAPFDTSTNEKQDTWKQVYNCVRTIVGSLAQLRGEGFDPNTETPCCPWFLTERREAADPPRQVIWRVGHALDLMALVLALPPMEEEKRVHVHDGPRTASEDGLPDEKLQEIIAALSQVTNSMPSGRHELYLALPGVLLDRGVSTDEVLAIIEAVSLSYPRSHPELHADNMHGARTTIGKWESGGHVTRIGTLNERWPEIAKAIDRVLPSVTALLAASTEQMLNSQFGAVTSAPGEIPEPTKKRRRKLSALGKEIAPVVASMHRSKNEKRRFAAKLIDRILDGESFQTQASTPEQVDALVCLTVETLGFDLPRASWSQILDLTSASFLSMDFTQSVERVAKAEIAFLKGQRKKRQWVEKNNEKVQEERLRSANLLRAAADAAAKGSH